MNLIQIARRFFGAKPGGRRFSHSKIANRYCKFTCLSYESLEDRRMLSVSAIGSFERTGGSVNGSAYAEASTATAGPVYDVFEQDSEESLIHPTATAQAGGGGFAYAHNEGTGFIPIPIDSTIAVPFTTGAYSVNAVASGVATAQAGFSEAFAGAGGVFEYNAPLGSSNLVFHGHMFIAAYGGETASGDAFVDHNLNVRASIVVGSELYFIEAGSGSSDWFVDGQLPDDVFIEFTSPGGANLHVHFVVPIADLTEIAIGSGASDYALARSYQAGDFADALWNMSSAAWGYVTGEGQDLSPGDFNADGEVDAADYQLWLDGSPMADADLNGIIDEDDLAIWAANTDILLVTTEIDENDMDHSFGDFSLREAIGVAASNPGDDTIMFAPWVEEILLTSGLNISSNVNVIGSGSDQLTIRGAAEDRVLHVGGATATIADLTIADGNWAGWGAGISAFAASVTLERVVVTGNVADGGAGIYAEESGFTLIDCTIDDNNNGGITVFNTDLEIFGSTISNNSGTVGGIDFSTNNGQSLTIANSTISGNTGNYAGGLSIYGNGSNKIVSSTITNNVTQSGTSPGGVSLGGYFTSVLMHNTIIAGNRRSDNSASDVATSIATFSSLSSYNLIGFDPNTSNNLEHGVNGNLVGGEGTNPAIDPRLTVLGDYGGRTKTHALLYNSPAIDAGDNAVAIAFNLDYDQRGEGFDRVVDWDEDLNARVDIGAFELALEELYS